MLWHSTLPHYQKNFTSGSSIDTNINHIRKQNRVQTNLAKMIILNATVSLLLRSPELFASSFKVMFVFCDYLFYSKGYVFAGRFIKNYYYMKNSVIDISDSLYGLTYMYILPFVLYYTFNLSFKKAFDRRIASFTFGSSFSFLTCRIRLID